ncbi:hypothetical protein V6R21_01510 [Limibacter armeniacum]|uniref:hypothetical protein n=1 Tax=Limibacter armeniacum TaxID=466084 RepID=UPI002FE6673C
MSKLKLYKLVAILLLLINLGMVAFFVLTKPDHRHPGSRPLHMLLQLDKQQEQHFLTLAHKHQQAIREIDQKQQDLLVQYFSALQQETTPSQEILAKIQMEEGKKIVLTYQHFHDVKTMLKPSQKPFFDQFMTGALEHILGEKEKKSPPPKDF